MNGRGSLYESRAVYQFGKDMRAVLRRNAHKGSWNDMTLDWDRTKLQEEYLELVEELRRFQSYGGLPLEERRAIAARIGKEATDLANVCMMISDRYGQLGRVQ